MGIAIPNTMYTPPRPHAPFLPLTIKMEVMASKINAPAKISENHIHQLLGL